MTVLKEATKLTGRPNPEWVKQWVPWTREPEPKMGLVAVSGGFDPIHPGHIKHIEEAKKLGSSLIILLASDRQLLRKKGYYFQPYLCRKEILSLWSGAVEVFLSDDIDGTCTTALETSRPTIFAKGGDRITTTMPQRELDICVKIGCKIVYDIGGEKRWSSSDFFGTAIKMFMINKGGITW